MGFIFQIAPACLLLTTLVTLWNFFGGSTHHAPTWYRHAHASSAAAAAGPAALFSTPHGIQTQPASAEQDKVVVMGAMSNQNTSWVEEKLPNWGRAIYTIDASAMDVDTLFRLPTNKGNEANVYLWHIIQHYDNLPEVTAFLHSHEDRAWHVDNQLRSNAVALQNLRLDAVRRNGFVNLRCISVPGCPAGVSMDWDHSRTEYDEEDPLGTETQTSLVMPDALMAMFPNGLAPNAGPVTDPDVHHLYPDQIAAPCCGQFAVSRDQIRQRPKSEYERYHRWLMGTNLNDYTSGRVMELLWHIIFGQPAVYCPSMGQCYREQFEPGYPAGDPPPVKKEE